MHATDLMTSVYQIEGLGDFVFKADHDRIVTEFQAEIERLKLRIDHQIESAKFKASWHPRADYLASPWDGFTVW